MLAADPIDQHLRLLSRHLRGPARLKADLLLEARHGLEDAAASFLDAGLSDVEAAHRAVAEFGPVSAVAGAYQLELAASTTRRLSIRIVGIWLLLLLAADRMWQGAPWVGAAAPPTGYRLLSASLSGAWAVAGLTAGSAYLYLTWTARRGRVGECRTSRAFGRGLTGWLLIGAGLGIALFAWSLALWEAARSWPPMIIGMSAVGIAYIWLGRAARDCLLATANAKGFTRGPRQPLCPGNARP